MKKVLMQGNIALCEGAISAGCFAYVGYPITPQNEVSAYMSKRMPELNRIFLQAESELASINVVFGVLLTGKRAMTSSSSPGISLMQEEISYMCGCELPAVIVNVMRGGPGLGNISGSQSDYFQATKGGGHGDYRLIVLAPHSVQEIYDLAKLSFDLADKYRNPVMILMDGYLGQMMEGITVKQIQNSIVKNNYNKDWILDGCKGRPPHKIRSLYMGEGELEKFNWYLNSKYEKIKQNEIKFEMFLTDNSEFLIIAFGIVGRISKGVIHELRNNGYKIGLFRPITLWPFPYQMITELSKKVKKIFVIEMNLGQMLEDVKMCCDDKNKIEFIGKPGGSIFSKEELVEKLTEKIKNEKIY